MRTIRDGVNLTALPSGTGCVECLAGGGWWVHLRRCAECGHIGCCDNSPGQHATQHQAETGHSVIQSFEPGEDWFFDYRTDDVFWGPRLPDPQSRPAEQQAPGPKGRVPVNWRALARG